MSFLEIVGVVAFTVMVIVVALAVQLLERPGGETDSEERE